MATYEEIYGKRVKDFDSDPTLDSSYEGQVWYNSATGTLKSVVAFDSFTSSASMGTGRYQAMWAGEGTQNATLSCSGRTAAPAIVTNTEEYNGSGWTVGGACNNAENSCAGFGTQTAAIKTGGYPGSDPEGLATESESYNGTSWTAGNAISPGRQGHAGAGVSTAGVIFGGNDGTVLNKTEEFNGTNFSNVNNMNTARQNLSGVGIQTAALAAGGGTTPVTTAAEVYDGTNWTTVGSMNTARQGMGSFGTSTSAAVTGGSTGSNSTATETWDGTSWTTSPATLATARAFYGDCGAGSSTAGIVAGGYSTATIGNTEEYNKSINTFTAAAWASGGAYPTATADVGSAGTRTAGLIFAGETPAPAVTQATNEYNGSTFSSGGNTVVGRAFMTGLGTQTAAVGVGGAPSFIANSESYDGSSWSEGNDINTARGNAMAAGTQTAGLLFGGYNGSSLANTENYDGTSWTNNPNGLNTARRGSGGCGTQTAALCAAGYSTTFIDVVEEYNGTSWSEVTNVPLKRHAFRCVGTQTAALGSGGYLPGPQGGPGNLPTNSITYDGTSWSTNPSLATGNSRGGQAGTTTASFVTAGQLGSGTTTENFDAESTTVTASTLTTS